MNYFMINYSMLLGSFGIIFLGLCGLISSVLLIFTIPVSVVNVILALICTIFILSRIVNIPIKKVMKVAVVWSILFVFLLILFSLVYDVAWDSNAYHKLAIGALCDGWNPIYQDILTFTQNSVIFKNFPQDLIVQDWLNHFPAGNWYIGACIYSITNSIESAKAVNLLYMISLFLIMFSFLQYHFLNSKIICLILSAIVCFNPIALVQVFTLYLDGLFSTIFFLVAVLLLMIFYQKEYSDSLKKLVYINLFMCIVVGCNLKFTTLGVFAFVGFTSFVVYLLKLKFERASFHDYKKITLFWVITVIGIFILGASSYVKNTLRYLHPFYPMYKITGENLDIMVPYQPEMFAVYSPLKKFLLTLFSPTGIQWRQDDVVLKIPFTFHANEFKMYPNYLELQRGGFGVFFSGLFLISLLIIIFQIFKFLKKKKIDWEECFLFALLALVILLVSIIDASWVARYSGYFYIFIPVACFFLFMKKEKKIIDGLLIGCFVCLTIINNITFILYPCKLLKESNSIRQVINDMSRAEVVQISTTKNWGGTLYNFYEEEINYIFVDKIENPDGNILGYDFKLDFED